MANTTGRKHAGRQKGTPNRKTQDLHELAERLNVNPFEILLHYASRNYQALGLPEKTLKFYGEFPSEEYTISPELSQKSAKDACEYLFPKRKSVEVKTDLSHLSDEELLSTAGKLLGEMSGKRKPSN